ncbi:MAG: hypothetical protein IT320_27545 [Anaerolineae bacterium]|nr:hypothetical protein [Anaerolineae bacterium]
MKRLALVLVLIVLAAAVLVAPAAAKPGDCATTVPGHCDRYDEDNNGYPDAGVYVNGHYTSVYAYDDNGDYYWDLGDGRIQGTVGSVDALDAATLTVCDYVVNYRVDYGNDPYSNEGWIMNQINCYGYDDNGHYSYLIVSQTDPRYRGNPDWAVWGTWEYHVDVEWKLGNLVRPEHAVGN